MVVSHFWPLSAITLTFSQNHPSLQGLFKFDANSEEFYLSWCHEIQKNLRKQTRKPFHFVLTHYVGPNGRQEKAALFYRSDKVSLDKSIQIPDTPDFKFSPVLFEFSRFSGKSKGRSGVVQKFSLINYRGDDDVSEFGKSWKPVELMKLPTLEETFNSLMRDHLGVSYYNHTVRFKRCVQQVEIWSFLTFFD